LREENQTDREANQKDTGWTGRGSKEKFKDGVHGRHPLLGHFWNIAEQRRDICLLLSFSHVKAPISIQAYLNFADSWL
jgi:hypothetical protein